VEIEIKMIPIRFMWIPGINPVIVPKKIPRIKNKKISSNIYLFSFFLSIELFFVWDKYLGNFDFLRRKF